MFWGCRWATRTFNSLQRLSMGLRSGDWLGHSRTLKCFLRSHSSLPGRCVRDHCHAERPSHVSSSMPLLIGRRFSLKISRYMAPFILSFTQISRPGPFAEKQPPKHDVYTPMLHSKVWWFFGCNLSIFLLQTRQVELYFAFHHMTFSNPLLDHPNAL